MAALAAKERGRLAQKVEARWKAKLRSREMGLNPSYRMEETN